jgi:hypothetical protein
MTGPATWEEVVTAMARLRGSKPWKLPRWVFRLIAPLVASVAVDTSMRVSAAEGTCRTKLAAPVPDLSRRHRRYGLRRSAGVSLGALIGAFPRNFTPAVPLAVFLGSFRPARVKFPGFQRR